MICEPIPLIRDDDGVFHFGDEALPLKTVIDTHNLPFGSWLKRGRAKLTFELDGREVIYDRIAVTPEGYWICRMRVDPATIVNDSDVMAAF